jgi:hypothetical protein
MPAFLKYISIVFMFSFLFHLGWEWMQCQPYFIHAQSKPNLFSMIIATLGDVLLTFIIFGLSAVVSQNEKLRSDKFILKILILIELFSLVLSVAIERYALSKNRWIYTDANPIIPLLGVSILPVLQLMLLSPLIYILSSLLSKHFISERKFRNFFQNLQSDDT